MITVVDVARRAEVSTITVSRVLNDDPRVRPRTRRLVLQAIEELGYVPNEAARALRRMRSRTIGFVATDLRALGSMNFLEGLSDVVSKHGYALMVCDSRRSLEVEAGNLLRLYERRVDGVVVIPVGDTFGNLGLFARAGIPHLPLFASKPTESDWEPMFNLREEVRQLLAYMADMGHRRIGLIYSDNTPRAAWLPHYVEIGPELGLDPNPSLRICCATTDEAHEAAGDLLKLPQRPTAILCAWANYTPFVLRAIREAGMSIPGDVSLVTAGDSPWYALHSPPLTALDPDYVQVGRVSANYLFARIAGHPAEEHLHEVREALRYKLTTRESCAPPLIA